MVSCVSRLNQVFGLELNHHDINFMYSLCGKIKSDYYLKMRDMWVQLISCLPNSNRNSAGEFVRVSGNWLANELPYPLSSHDVSWYLVLSFVLDLILLLGFLMYILTSPFIDLLQKEKDSNRISELHT